MIQTAKDILEFFSSFPVLLAILFGWAAALAFTQTAKQLIPLDWHDASSKRLLLVVAIVTGFLFAWKSWPANSLHPILYPLVVGMMAPTAYKALQAFTVWKFPDFADKLSWSKIRFDRKIAGQEKPALPAPPPPEADTVQQ